MKKQVSTRLVTDSSSCRAFAQRLGVGKLKHVDTKFLWLQLMIKNNVVSMDSVNTLFNMSDLGTKKLTKARRAFLMFLAGMVFFNEETKEHEPVGEEECNEQLRRKSMGKSMKMVQKVVLGTLRMKVQKIFRPSYQSLS